MDELTVETHSPDHVRLAVWFHGVVFSTSKDAIYSHNGGEDEVASANAAHDVLEGLGVPQDTVSSICSLIRGMRDRKSGLNTSVQDSAVFDAVDIDQIALRDAHLAVLAADPQDYRKYSHDIRQEYASIPDATYYAGRMRVLQRLLARKRLFVSPLAHEWEHSARQNLTAELERIETVAAEEAQHSPDTGPTPEGGPSDPRSTTTDVHGADAVDEPDQILSSEENPVLTESEVASQRNEDEEAVRYAHSAKSACEEFKPTLREPDESFEPGLPPRELSVEEQEIARREKISEDTLRLIESRKESARDGKEAADGELEPGSAGSGLEKSPDH
ncbi:hypothetical protein [Trueperella sp.]|uniref:HD domain-containing protein n=1 Tax=Trueperella sp. TaxID=2699835 RepID=UPI00373673BE